jgi:hypothetical protein
MRRSCGERDCFELADSDVIAKAGYFVNGLKETIPYGEVQPSPDGHFWRCQWGGTVDEDGQYSFAVPL